MPENHSQPVYVRLPERLIRELDELIRNLPGNRSDHMRLAIQEYVERLRAGRAHKTTGQNK